MTDVDQAVDGMHLNAMNRWLTKGAFRFMLLKRAYTKPELEKMLTGFKKAEVRPDAIGMEAWFEK